MKMDVTGFAKLWQYKTSFAASDAANYIRGLKNDVFPLFGKRWNNKKEYHRRIVARTLCDELADELMATEPWEDADYRMIISEKMYRPMMRVVEHIQNGSYACRDGKQLMEADKLFLDLWQGYDAILREFPGEMPINTEQNRYLTLLVSALNTIK